MKKGKMVEIPNEIQAVGLEFHIAAEIALGFDDLSQLETLLDDIRGVGSAEVVDVKVIRKGQEPWR